jgi:hypothetical protein
MSILRSRVKSNQLCGCFVLLFWMYYFDTKGFTYLFDTCVFIHDMTTISTQWRRKALVQVLIDIKTLFGMLFIYTLRNFAKQTLFIFRIIISNNCFFCIYKIWQKQYQITRLLRTKHSQKQKCSRFLRGPINLGYYDWIDVSYVSFIRVSLTVWFLRVVWLKDPLIVV